MVHGPTDEQWIHNMQWADKCKTRSQLSTKNLISRHFLGKRVHVLQCFCFFLFLSPIILHYTMSSRELFPRVGTHFCRAVLFAVLCCTVLCRVVVLCCCARQQNRGISQVRLTARSVHSWISPTWADVYKICSIRRRCCGARMDTYYYVRITYINAVACISAHVRCGRQRTGG